MNPVALFFASGESLYPGAALLLIAGLSAASRRRHVVWLRRVATWVGFAFMVMASPPMPWWIDIFFGIIFLWWAISTTWSAAGTVGGRLQKSASVLLIIMLLGISTVELIHRRLPIIRGGKSDHLVILGDSISAGLGTHARPWPDLMKETTGASIINLSRPGAAMTDGLSMADLVTARDTLILIELGGNDILAGERPEQFAQSLDRLLVKLTSPGRTVVMFELPLLPQMIPYGQAQRRIAKEHRIFLIPKRCLTDVFSGEDATADGLHLSDLGSRRMASLVTDILRPVLWMGQAVPTAPAIHP